MWWRESRASFRRFASAPMVLAAGLMVAGCYQPLYGEGTLPGGRSVQDALRTVEVTQIDVPQGSNETKLAVQIRNDLMFNFTGGGAPPSPTHRLKLKIGGGRSIVSIDRASALPNIESYGFAATYSLIEIASGKTVLEGKANSTLSYDPMGQQRFARISGMQDAERRAAKVAADTITTRVSAYFLSGM